jgi:hypothetical protein
MAYHSSIYLRYKRDSQRIVSTQRIYYELLCLIAYWMILEGSYRDFGYCLNICNRLISYDHFNILFSFAFNVVAFNFVPHFTTKSV